MSRNPNAFRRPNDVAILNDFYRCDMRFLAMQITEEELGPIRYVSDLETEERIIFVSYSPEVYDGQEI